MDKGSIFRLLAVVQFGILVILAILLFIGVPPVITLVLMAGVLIAAFLYVRVRLRRHYQRISDVVRLITDGDHSQRIPELELNEFDLLGRDLNTMLGKLDETISHLAVHREELRLVLGSISDVLWSQDFSGEVEWANKSFRELFPAYDPRRIQMYWEVIRNPELLEKLNESKTAKGRFLGSIQMDGHSYILSVNRNDQAQRVVFILHNVDAIQQAEQMKKDFIVNLAHELRTPLTAIRGFTEAMLQDPEKDKVRPLKIIHNHTLRLIHLISDLEQLIRLESSGHLERQEINLETFFDNIQMVLRQEVEEKGLFLEFDLDPEAGRLVCDPFRLEQVFINLVQNSLRYTETGGITISSKAEGEVLHFSVEDTGKGIGEEHLSRIFERFYVADPSRNKSKSGTGLGLAIVKHIVLLHRGQISVESVPGKGTAFHILLPLSEKDSA
jgi:two-component system, OmpR family, phosphate regulon sensor histidine kinase PhoR